MTKLFFTVLESFNISGRGVSVITDQTRDEPTFRNGDEVELRRPDGTVIRAKCYIEFLCGRTDPSAPYYDNNSFGFMGLSKTDIPPGTQAFQLVEHQPFEGSRHYEVNQGEESEQSNKRRHTA